LPRLSCSSVGASGASSRSVSGSGGPGRAIRFNSLPRGMCGQTARRTLETHARQRKLGEARESHDIRRDGAAEPVVSEVELLERRSERCEHPQRLRERRACACDSLLSSHLRAVCLVRPPPHLPSRSALSRGTEGL